MMHMDTIDILELIEKKKHGQALSREEIVWFVSGFTAGKIPPYQASALLMAIWFSGMTISETSLLTEAMMQSGDVVDLSGIKGVKVDKHSTGGVGDKTTLVLVPMLAACGMKVAKMSGRGLGHTGGTVDKLESIPGFQLSFTREQFLSIVEKTGAVIASQTASVAPADKKIYALRDVTGTVDNIPLIASSVMSKKLACGADSIVLDVKCGSGSFMKTPKDAALLASWMVAIGQEMKKNVRAVITDMNQPLGRTVGNALEVEEAIETLSGRGEEDLRELSVVLGANLMSACGMASDIEDAEAAMRGSLVNGKALAAFADIIEAQGGDTGVLTDYSLFPKARYAVDVLSEYNGYVSRIDCGEVGIVSLKAGAGREKLGADIDASAGIVLNKKLGETVRKGERLAVIYTSKRNMREQLKQRLSLAWGISDTRPVQQPLVYEIIK